MGFKKCKGAVVTTGRCGAVVVETSHVLYVYVSPTTPLGRHYPC